MWQQSNKSEWRLAFDLQQAGLSHCPPAKKCVENWAGDQWAPLAWHHAGQRGKADGPSGDLLARDRDCSVSERACYWVCVSSRPGDVVLGDHLSCSCSSSLSCVVSRTILSQPDPELCCDISYHLPSAIPTVPPDISHTKYCTSLIWYVVVLCIVCLIVSWYKFGYIG